MARDVRPIVAWVRAQLLARDDIAEVVGARVFQAWPQKGQLYPGIALWQPTVEYDQYAQGGTTAHDVLVPIELAGTNPDELTALEAAVVSAFEPPEIDADLLPDGWRVDGWEWGEPSPPRVDLDVTPTLHRRVLDLAVTAVPLPV